MMQYCIIEGYAYDVTDDTIEDDVIMMSYESRRAQNAKKYNIVTVVFFHCHFLGACQCITKMDCPMPRHTLLDMEVKYLY